MLAATLRAHGVADGQISLIPDEQEAIDAALRMAQKGDLLLVFADALTRSWKQIIKFKPAGGMVREAPVAPVTEGSRSSGFDPERFSAMGATVTRDARGIVISRDQDD